MNLPSLKMEMTKRFPLEQAMWIIYIFGPTTVPRPKDTTIFIITHEASEAFHCVSTKCRRCREEWMKGRNKCLTDKAEPPACLNSRCKGLWGNRLWNYAANCGSAREKYHIVRDVGSPLLLDRSISDPVFSCWPSVVSRQSVRIQCLSLRELSEQARAASVQALSLALWWWIDPARFGLQSPAQPTVCSAALS